MEKYYGHGKLLLSSEYFILKGAKGLSIPLNLGQSMEVEACNDDQRSIVWEVSDVNGHWFHAVLDKRNLKVLQTDHEEMAHKLVQILKKARGLNNKKFKDRYTYNVTCYVQFDKSWGLGSSSTLLSNIGLWLGIDAMDLHFKVSEGSGYDVATAQINLPIVYHLHKSKYPVVRAVPFNPPFAGSLYFIYSGEKVDSSQSIQQFRPSKAGLKEQVTEISQITEEMVTCNRIEDFMELMQKHENIVSNALGTDTLKTHYPDFKGTLKSLGSWGGDFMLAACTEGDQYVTDYFTNKGLQDVFPYHQLALYSHEI